MNSHDGLGGQTKIVAAPQQVSANLSGEAVILNMSDSTYYGLNDVGTRVWELLKEPTSVDAIVEALLEEYEVEPPRCREDVLRLLGELLAKKLVLIHDDDLDGSSG